VARSNFRVENEATHQLIWVLISKAGLSKMEQIFFGTRPFKSEWREYLMLSVTLHLRA
jgi:hypothetical protein